MTTFSKTILLTILSVLLISNANILVAQTFWRAPTFEDRVYACLGFQYKPYFNSSYIDSEYGDVPLEKGLRVKEKVKFTKTEKYYAILKNAKNAKHLADLITQIEIMQKRVQILTR